MGGKYHYFVQWKADNREGKNSIQCSWEPLENLCCPQKLKDYYNRKKLQIPKEVTTFLKTLQHDFITGHDSSPSKIYKGYKNTTLVGSNEWRLDLEGIPDNFLTKQLPGHPIFFTDERSNVYKSYTPSTFHVTTPVIQNGKVVNCIGNLITHLTGKPITRKYVADSEMVKTIEQFSGYKLIELYHFNSSKVRQINKNRRKRHNKQILKNKSHALVSQLEYWKIFQIKVGFLVLECATKNGFGSSHILAVNFEAK